mgnify:CR=1 FL=1
MKKTFVPQKKSGGIKIKEADNAASAKVLFLQLLDLLHGVIQDVAGGQGVGAAEGTAGYQIALVGGDGQALLQGRHGLRGTHGQHHNFGTVYDELYVICGCSARCAEIDQLDANCIIVFDSPKQ